MALNEYSSYDDVSGYSLSANAKEQITNIKSVVQYNNLGIFGAPYQFMDTVDDRLEGTELGHKYAEKITARMPLLFIAPCRQKFMEGFNSEDRETVLNALISGEGLNGLENSLSTVGKYYTTEYDTADYYKHVNMLCAEVAIFLGIGDEYIPLGGGRKKIKEIQWETIRNSGFKSYFYADQCTVFYLDSFDNISDSFGNSTTESSLASTINGFSDQANEVKFLLGNDSALSQMVSKASDISSSISGALSGTVSNVFGGMLGDLAKTGVSTILTGGKIVFPKIWQDFNFDRSYSFELKLRSPDHDSISIFLNILVPYLHILALTLPVGMQADPNGYTSPFLCKAYCKGMFNIDMGLITSLSCSRGATTQWNADGLPTQMDVSFTIEDLYSTLFMTNLTRSASAKFSDLRNIFPVACAMNTSMMDYLSNLAGLNIAEEELMRRTTLLSQLMGVGVKNIPSDLWNRFDDKLNNLIGKLYHRL